MLKHTTRQQRIAAILKRPHVRILIPSPDGGYAAAIPDFPGCYSQGETPEEAARMIEDAAQGWLEATIDLGHDIPEPTNWQAFLDLGSED